MEPLPAWNGYSSAKWEKDTEAAKKDNKTLADKLKKITEPSLGYAEVIPMEMISVLLPGTEARWPYCATSGRSTTRSISQATMSYGYGLSVTPLQLAQAFAVEDT